MSVLSWVGRTFGLTDNRALSYFFGAPNNTGQSVTTDSVLSIAAAWACIRLLSESVGIMPLGVFRKNAAGGREALLTHPAYDLLHNKPNDEMTADEFRQVLTANMALYGNALLMPLKYRDRVTALEFVPWRDVTVRRDNAYRLQYDFNWHGKRFEMTGRDVVHFRSFGLGEDVGLSAIRYGSQTFGIALAADRSAGRAFRSGKNPSGFVTTDKVLNPEQRADLTKSLSDFRMMDTDDGIMLLQGGLKWERTGITMADLQILQARGYSFEQVCSWFRVPPFMVGHTEKNTSWGAGLEQQMIAFLTLALDPYLTRIEERLMLSVLTEADRAAGIYVEFNRDAILQSDSAARAALYAVMADHGIYTRNEIRDKENMPRMEGGDDLTVQSAMIRLQDLEKMAQAEGGTGGPAAQKLRQALQTFLDVQDSAAVRASIESALLRLPAPNPDDSRQT